MCTVCCQRYIHVCTYCRTGSAFYIVKCARSRVMDLQMKHTPPLMHRYATHSLKPADAHAYEYVYTHTHAHAHFHYNTRHIPSPSVYVATYRVLLLQNSLNLLPSHRQVCPCPSQQVPHSQLCPQHKTGQQDMYHTSYRRFEVI